MCNNKEDPENVALKGEIEKLKKEQKRLKDVISDLENDIDDLQSELDDAWTRNEVDEEIEETERRLIKKYGSYQEFVEALANKHGILLSDLERAIRLQDLGVFTKFTQSPRT